MSTARGCPPRRLCLAGGIIGATIVHCSSVRSEGYLFRDWSFFNIRAHSSAEGICANYLLHILFCQALFPDSLSEMADETRRRRRKTHDHPGGTHCRSPARAGPAPHVLPAMG